MTAIVVIVAALLVFLKYWNYLLNPWTRDGQVRAEVIQITPRVSGPVVALPIRDNQLVKTGELLFEIDPRTYRASRDQAEAQYDKTADSYRAQEQQVEASRANVRAVEAQVRQAHSTIKEIEASIAKNKAEFERQQELLPQKATSKKAVERAKANYDVSAEKRVGALASLAQYEAELAQIEAQLAEDIANLGARGAANASLRKAKAELEQAELDLEFTRAVAPVDGYVTNLNLRIGSQAVANQPVLALVDINSYWVHGFFRETAVSKIRPGDKAIVTLMSYPDDPLEGAVDSIGWGISQQDGSTGFELLPAISPTFEWIRLAQRVPVRVHLSEIPEHIPLRVGTTASVLVKSGSAED